MEEKPNYYAIIPAQVRYDPELRANEKLLFGEITALSNTNGECVASNNYFSKLYNVVPSAITKWIKDLEAKHYIEVEYEKKGREIIKRYIKITGIHKYDQVFTKVVEGYSQKLKDNNTSNNNIKKEIYKERKFIKPTIEEIKNYCDERNNYINANSFYDFYESKDWYVGKNKMKDWKAAIRTWEARQPKKTTPEWFDKKIETIETESDDEFKNFIKEFRNA